MIKNILNINLVYLCLIILIWIIIMINCNKYKWTKKYKIILSSIYLILLIITFPYINGIIINIFKLKYLSVKTYLITLLIVNSCFLFTLNRKLKPIYTILNYLLFIIITIIFGATISIVLGNKLESLYLMEVSNAINLIDLSIIIFMIYLILISLTYIGYYLSEYGFSLKKEETKEILEEEINPKKKFNLPKVSLPKVSLPKIRKKKKIMTRDELLNFDRNNILYINGIDCNIIFNDSNKDNIYKNYQILNKDIDAKMVNGYTLNENKILRNICLKFGVSNLYSIDINNTNILNMISIEEYTLLKNVFKY